ncbi:MAG: PEP-CTERM sorting domain-containing protein [Heteroscytonema crispum UTEX LB 1556]
MAQMGQIQSSTGNSLPRIVGLTVTKKYVPQIIPEPGTVFGLFSLLGLSFLKKN